MYGNERNPEQPYGTPQFVGGTISGTLTSAPPRPAGIFTAVASEVAGATKGVYDLTSMARQIADNAFGVVPEKVSGQGVRASGTSMPSTQQLQSELGALHAALAELRTQIERLACI